MATVHPSQLVVGLTGVGQSGEVGRPAFAAVPIVQYEQSTEDTPATEYDTVAEAEAENG